MALTLQRDRRPSRVEGRGGTPEPGVLTAPVEARPVF